MSKEVQSTLGWKSLTIPLIAAAVVVALAFSLFTKSSFAEEATELRFEEVTYGNETVRLPGILVRPERIDGKAPAILALHGGGNSGLQRAMVWLAERLARRGYVVLSGTYRPPGSGRQEDLADAMMGVSYLAELSYVDTDRIGMTGQSRGAGNSYRTGAADPRVKSIMPISTSSTATVTGVEDRVPRNTRVLSEQRYMEQIRGAGGFPHELDSEESEDSPFPSIWEIRKPVLVLHGTWDLHAPAEGAAILKEQIRQRGVSNIRVNLIEGMGHFFDTPEGHMLDEIGSLAGDWFDETLRGIDTGRDFERPLVLPDEPAWPDSDVFSVRELTYKSADGANVPGYLIEPRQSNSRRGVVYAPDGHSGAIASRLAFVVSSLAKRGNTVLVTRFRGPVGAISDDQDIVGALDYLSSYRNIDDETLSVIGHGRGGMAALRSAASDQRIKAVVALGAPANLTRLLSGLDAYSPVSAKFQASRFTGPNTYQLLSPQYYARQIKVPVLLIHGTLDLMVAPEHMLWNGIALMTTGNTDVEFYMPPWEIHHFDSTFAWLKPEEWAHRIPDFLDARL